MSEIEQLRKDIEQAKEIMLRFYRQDRQALGLGEMFERLAKLEAEEAAKADPWAGAKKTLDVFEYHLKHGGENAIVHADVLHYVRYLQKRLTEIEAELARRPVAYCLRHRDYGFMLLLGETQIFPTKVSAELAKREDWIVEPYTGEWK